MAEISIIELKKLSDILLNHVFEFYGEKINIEDDLYWEILYPDRIVNGDKMPQLAVGSLTQDVEYLKKVLDGENIPTIVDVDRFANVLIQISDTVK